MNVDKHIELIKSCNTVLLMIKVIETDKEVQQDKEMCELTIPILKNRYNKLIEEIINSK